jgi:hypothetical protein
MAWEEQLLAGQGDLVEKLDAMLAAVKAQLEMCAHTSCYELAPSCANIMWQSYLLYRCLPLSD